MNKKTYRLVYSRLRGMVVAVEETAAAEGKSASGETGARRRRGATGSALLAVAAASATTVPIATHAQIVPTPGGATQVIQTPNGLPQVNIARPSGAGVSVNTYTQFDVQKAGAIVNNSAAMVQTQQAGWINGNPNFGPNDAARIIVNQVNSPNPSQIRGAIEIAGPRAQFVLANPAGIYVDGGGFINTSRATLTTGMPFYGADGSLAGYRVSQGLVTVAGAGLNASNIDQVDLLARAVQVNTAIYAKNLNVVTGANRVDANTLAATPIAGDGPAPGVSIDVAQLGGMYADRIRLVGTENGVGVNNAGVLAAQAGDLTLQSNGLLVLSGKTNAAGNLNVSAQGGIVNSGVVYGQQSASVSTGDVLANSGTLAAQQNLTVSASGVNSTGTLGAGVNHDGAIGRGGDLSVTAGQLIATGKNLAGGNASLTSGSVNLAGSQTAANGNLSLNANAGDLNLSGATASAQGAIQANAAGALINDHGSLSSGGGTTLAAGSVSNQGGKVSAQGPLKVQSAGQIANQAGQLVSGNSMEVRGGALSNRQGTIQSAAGMTLAGASLDNSAGRVTSLNGDGLSLVTTGQLTNAAGTTATGAQGGVIGGNGGVSVQAGNVVNHGALTAQTILQVDAQAVDNGGGSMSAGQQATIDAGAHLTNASGQITGQSASVNAATLDNSTGTIQANQVSLDATDLVNRGGTITQTGTGAMTVAVSNTLDNSNGGTLQTNSTDLTLAPATLINDAGKITHAGNGTLTLGNPPGRGTGFISNVGGKIASNGRVVAQAGALNNTSGSVIGQAGLNATLSEALNNTQGKLLSSTDATVKAGGVLTNDGGSIGANANATVHSGSLTNRGGSIIASNLSATADTTLDNSGGDLEANQLALTAANLINRGGKMTQFGASSTTVNVSNTLDNSAGGTLQTHSTDLTLAPATLINDGGTITHAGTGTLTFTPSGGSGSLSNVGGKIVSNGQIVARAGRLDNRAGTLSAQRGLNVTVGGALDNTQGKLLSNTDATIDVGDALTNDGGALGASSTATLHSGSLTNRGGSIVAPNLIATVDHTLDNSGGDLEANQLALTATNLTNHGGTITQYGASSTTVDVSQTLDNSAGGTLQTNSTDLTLAPATLINDGGAITHAGTGTLTIAPGSGAGSISNVAGKIISAGRIVAHAGSLNNASGT
ncbi:two-partner secretion domain-containing protein, partial [Burkholderia singularis]|uniref:two-partner secretion domain-containing protein n=1 Tax=Burkholderia singularis TaxID=1503053 RepID=UPI001180591C